MIKINYEGDCPKKAIDFLMSEARRIAREKNLYIFRYSLEKYSGIISIEQVMTGFAVIVGRYRETEGEFSTYSELLSKRDYESLPKAFQKDFKRTSNKSFWFLPKEKIKQIVKENT